jgi:DNA-binding response OmpR family regulator
VKANSGPVVLVADANTDTRALYQHAAAAAGLEVVGVEDGRDALVEALSRPPSLVLTEITLPLVDGLALCEILRRDRATSHIPILVVTAEARPSHLARARAIGADAVLIKPVAIEKILTEVQRLLTVGRETRAGDSRPTDGSTGSVAAQPAFRKRRRAGLAGQNTTTPPASPPLLVCPLCDARLVYERSHVGGVSERQREQWDHYDCARCGTFQYRHRTRRLRRVS